MRPWNFGNELYKSEGVFWRVTEQKDSCEKNIANYPVCPNCRSGLELRPKEYYCEVCTKAYPCPKEHGETQRLVNKKFQAHQIADQKIFSLDLPPTKVTDESEDENYWVNARIGEKDGKRMAVVYFGEKINGEQGKKDYSQIFVDFEDEQLRFDKGNKHPAKLLGKLVAEFPHSVTEVRKK